MEEYVDITSRRFLLWVNDRFREYLSPIPDKNAEPCLGLDGKVKKRGPWDTGPLFSQVASSSFHLMPHQQLVQQFFTEQSPYRGLLLYHSMGSGKTATAIAVAEQMKSRRQIVVLCPASLRDNFVSELKKTGGPAYQAGNDAMAAIGRSYYFLAYDAPNLPVQIGRIPDGLNNKLLIVDEVHGLISMMLSASIKGRAAFQSIMNATNLRVLLMSGTPVINDTFEIAIIANLLTGYLNSKQERLPRTVNPALLEDKNKHMLFNDLNEFYYYFVDLSNDGRLTLKNEDALKRRLNGLVSFFGGVQPRDRVFPRVTEHEVLVPMSAHQFELYNRVRTLESESEEKLRKRYAKSSGKKKANVDLRVLFSNSKKEIKVSNFRAFSRQFSNFAMPRGLPRPIPRIGDINAEAEQGNSELQGLAEDDMIDLPEESGESYTPAEQRMLDHALEMLDANSQDYLVKRLPEHSPKMHEMLKRIAVSPGTVYVYSQFRRIEGINIFALVLKANGMIEYGWRDPFFKGTKTMEPLAHTLDAYTGKRWGELQTPKEKATFRPLTYMFWPKSSANSSVMRNHLLNVFNSEANKTGQVIRAFLSTKAGAEGVNLMNVRQVHICEPYWNLPLLQQAAGRAIRMCSHATLPPADREVSVYSYITTVDNFPTKDFDSLKRPQSTDQYVKDIAIRKANLTNQALQLLKEISFDCRLNYNWNNMSSPHPIQCYDFQNTGKSLSTGHTFALDLSQEITDKDIRTNTKTRKIKLKRVKLFGTKYRVQKTDLKIIKRFMQGLFAKTEQQRVPLYHDISVVIIGWLILKYPNSSALEAA